jgi:hypothetical protein
MSTYAKVLMQDVIRQGGVMKMIVCLVLGIDAIGLSKCIVTRSVL